MKQIRLGYCAPIAALLAAMLAGEHAIAEDKAATEQEVAIDNLCFSGDEQRHLKPEFANGGDHPVDGMLVLAEREVVGRETVNSPEFDQKWR